MERDMQHSITVSHKFRQYIIEFERGYDVFFGKDILKSLLPKEGEILNREWKTEDIERVVKNVSTFFSGNFNKNEKLKFFHSLQEDAKVYILSIYSGFSKDPKKQHKQYWH